MCHQVSRWTWKSLDWPSLAPSWPGNPHCWLKGMAKSFTMWSCTGTSTVSKTEPTAQPTPTSRSWALILTPPMTSACRHSPVKAEDPSVPAFRAGPCRMVGWHLHINTTEMFDLITLNEGFVFTHGCSSTHRNTVLFTICLQTHENYVILFKFWTLCCCFFAGFVSTESLASTSQYCTTWCLLIHRVLISLHARVTLTHQLIPPVIRWKSAHSTLFLMLF